MSLNFKTVVVTMELHRASQSSGLLSGEISQSLVKYTKFKLEKQENYGRLLSVVQTFFKSETPFTCLNRP